MRALRWAIPTLVLLGFAAHVALRSLVSDSVEIDEGEQLLVTQSLRLGYGAQPPLYDWIQALGFEVLGVNVFALALTKHLILVLTYVFTYATTRAITRDEKSALLAVLLVLLLPQISYESHRTLTHSVLATSMAAAALWAFVRVSQRADAASHALLGLAAGLGIVSKYAFVLFLAGLVAAGLSIARFRAPLASRRIAIAVVVMLAVSGPHLLWLAAHWAEATAGAPAPPGGDATGGAAGMARSALDALADVGGLLAAVVILSAAIFATARPARQAPPALADHASLCLRTFVFAIAAGVLVAGASGITDVKARWFQPTLCLVPVYLAIVLYPRITAARLAIAAGAGALAVCLALGALYFRATAPAVIGRHVLLHVPTGVLAAELRHLGFANGVILSNRREIAGGLRLFFDASVHLIQNGPVYGASRDVPWAVVWRGDVDAKTPESLRRRVEQVRGVALDDYPVHRVVARYRGSAGIPVVFKVVIIAPG